jgi:hypothetical protein
VARAAVLTVARQSLSHARACARFSATRGCGRGDAGRAHLLHAALKVTEQVLRDSTTVSTRRPRPSTITGTRRERTLSSGSLATLQLARQVPQPTRPRSTFGSRDGSSSSLASHSKHGPWFRPTTVCVERHKLSLGSQALGSVARWRARPVPLSVPPSHRGSARLLEESLAALSAATADTMLERHWREASTTGARTLDSLRYPAWKDRSAGQIHLVRA